MNNLKANKSQTNREDIVINDLRQEIHKLKSENEDLRDRNTNLSYVMADLHTKVKNLENEKLCLITTLKLLHLDREECQKVSDKQVENKGWHTEGPKGLVKSLPTDRANEQTIE